MAHKVVEVTAAKQQRPIEELHVMLSSAPPARDFLSALQQQEHVALIAEVKKASPSKGVFTLDFDPVAIAKEYAACGASAISVLTDEEFFQGSLSNLESIRQAVDVPLLRKEFVFDAYQIIEGRIAGADAILLIVACLDDALLQDLYQYIHELGMHALIEVHTPHELERAMKLNPSIIGINNRDLHTFQVDLNTTINIATLCPPNVVLVAESGIYTTDDVQRLAKAGAKAILVGESLIRAENRPAQIAALSGVKR
ncbi:MAG: indole-3-glycerol phosphate synthase TrpC [Phototrophicales bacterium]|nr:MAG: indole-3-glycerol phosphate synthase TrpC [Phototrophicales bacterium]